MEGGKVRRGGSDKRSGLKVNEGSVQNKKGLANSNDRCGPTCEPALPALLPPGRGPRRSPP